MNPKLIKALSISIIIIIYIFFINTKGNATNDRQKEPIVYFENYLENNINNHNEQYVSNNNSIQEYQNTQNELNNQQIIRNQIKRTYQLKNLSFSNTPYLTLNDTDKTVEVSKWDQFVAAVNDSTIVGIKLTNNLQATNNLANFNSSKKVVLFNSYAINMGIYNMVTSNGNINFSDATISSTSTYYPIKSSGGTLIFSGDTTINGNLFTNTRGDSNLQFINATATITNNNSFYYPAIDMENNISNILFSNSTLSDNTNNFIYLSGNQKNITLDSTTITSTQPSQSSSAYFLFTTDQRTNQNSTTILNVKNNSHINVEKNIADDFYAPIHIFAPKSQINIIDGSTLKVTNNCGSAISESGDGSSFNVSGEGTELDLTRTDLKSLGVYNNAVIRFAWTGNMKFNISNKAKVKINQNSATNTYGIRMFGGGNNISVSGGAEFDLYNKSSSGYPGIGDNGGEGIYYIGSGVAGSNNSFILNDPDSQVLISAQNGPAISSYGSDITINAKNGTSFVSRGYYPNNAIFTANSYLLTFKMDVPRYFDFMNTSSITNKNNSSLLFSGSSSSTFSHGAVPLAVWKSGSDVVNASPDKSWNYVSATYNGTNFQNVTTTTTNNDFLPWMNNNKGLSQLGRITANVSPAKIIAPPQAPTNADKYIWIPALMPAANNEFRAAYDQEVYANVQLTLPDGTIKQLNSQTSISSSNYYEYAQGGKISGVIKIPVSNFGSGDYLQAGSTIKVTKLWRNDSDPNSEAAIISKSTDDTYSTQTVIDKVPPAVAKITDNVTSISPVTNQLTGVNGEPNATLSWKVIKQNQQLVSSGSTIVQSGGNWSIPNLGSLNNDYQIQLVMTDVNGNSNPLVDTIYHDMTFPKATIISVEGSLDLNVPNELYFGKHKVNDHNYLPISKLDSAISITDTLNSTGWHINLSSTGIKNDSNEIPLYYNDGSGIAKRISSTSQTVYTKTTPLTNWTPFAISNNWTINNNSVTQMPIGPFLKIPDSTRAQPKKYEGTLNWSLIAGP